MLIFDLLLTEMGQYRQVQVYFERLFSSDIIDERATLSSNIGRVNFHKDIYIYI